MVRPVQIEPMCGYLSDSMLILYMAMHSPQAAQDNTSTWLPKSEWSQWMSAPSAPLQGSFSPVAVGGKPAEPNGKRYSRRVGWQADK